MMKKFMLLHCQIPSRCGCLIQRTSHSLAKNFIQNPEIKLARFQESSNYLGNSCVKQCQQFRVYSRQTIFAQNQQQYDDDDENIPSPYDDDAVDGSSHISFNQDARENEAPHEKLAETQDSHDEYSLTFTKDGYVVVYTDGSCLGNQLKSRKAGVGVYFGSQCPLNISRELEGKRTSNRAELSAATLAIEQARDAGFKRIEIRTDSNLLIQTMNTYLVQWRKRGLRKTDGSHIANLEDIMALEELTSTLQVRFKFVKAHSTSHGNKQADLLARKAAQSQQTQEDIS